MNTAVKLVSFVAAMGVVLVLSYGIGRVVGPVGDTQAPAAHPGGHAVADPSPSPDPASLPGGLMVSQDGYRLDLDTDTLAAGRSAVAVTVRGPDGRPVTRFDTTHDKDVHLIAVRRDTTGFQHLHPTMDAAGTWTSPVELTPGTWRIFADFTPSALGRNLTLGTDLSVPGETAPQPVPPEQRTATTDGGDIVTVSGDLVAGASSPLTFEVLHDGRPATDLQPDLGAAGHLVALRVGDLAYLHMHPDQPADGHGSTPGSITGPAISFRAEVPSTGTYRLFLDFRRGGRVHTAAFTLRAVPGPARPTSRSDTGASTGHASHGD